MSNVTALKYQTLFDVATQETGSIESVFAIALANGLSITGALDAGRVILIPDKLVVDAKAVDYLLARQIKPASDSDNQSFEPLNWGTAWIISPAAPASDLPVVMKGQTLFDIAVQETGSVENALAIAIANGLSLSGVVEVERAIKIPGTIIKEAKVVDYLALKGIKPASDADETNTEITLPEGIGSWAIEIDFKIS